MGSGGRPAITRKMFVPGRKLWVAAGARPRPIGTSADLDFADGKLPFWRRRAPRTSIFFALETQGWIEPNLDFSFRRRATRKFNFSAVYPKPVITSNSSIFVGRGLPTFFLFRRSPIIDMNPQLCFFRAFGVKFSCFF